MPRRNRRHIPPSHSHQELPRDGATYWGTRRAPGPSWAQGEEWFIRQMGASLAVKFYLCPGCNQNIPPGTAHIVAWPDTHRGAADRRHWHSGCWARR